MIIGSALTKTRNRISSDDCWPLRRANGKTWAQSKKESGNVTSVQSTQRK